MRIDPRRAARNRIEDLAGVRLLLHKTILSARQGDYGDAASGMNLLVQDLLKALSQGDLSAADFQKMQKPLEAVLVMQKDGDWVAVADVLEYDLQLLL